MTLLPSPALTTGVLSFSWDFASSELRRSGTETWWENVYSFPLRLFFSRQLNNQHQNTIFLKEKNSCMKEALIFTKFWTLFTQNISSWSLENATAQVVLVKSGSFSFRSKTKSTTITLSFPPPPPPFPSSRSLLTFSFFLPWYNFRTYPTPGGGGDFS